MTDYLQKAVGAFRKEAHRQPGGPLLDGTTVRRGLRAVEPILEAHYREKLLTELREREIAPELLKLTETQVREKLEARLLSDGAEALAALIYESQRTYSQPTWDAPEPLSGRSWLTPHRRDYYRGRARKYLLTALQVDEETTR